MSDFVLMQDYFRLVWVTKWVKISIKILQVQEDKIDLNSTLNL